MSTGELSDAEKVWDRELRPLVELYASLFGRLERDTYAESLEMVEFGFQHLEKELQEFTAPTERTERVRAPFEAACAALVRAAHIKRTRLQEWTTEYDAGKGAFQQAIRAGEAIAP